MEKIQPLEFSLSRYLRITIISVGLVAGGQAFAETPAPDRQAELLHQLKHDCGSCHGMTMKGGLGPDLLPARLADRENEDLIDIILNGIPGTPMPPWKIDLGQGEAAWLVDKLKSGNLE